MSVRFNKQRSRWTVDLEIAHPDGSRERVRKFSPVNTRRGAEAYGRELLNEVVSRKKASKVPRLDQFVPEFIEKYAKVHNRQMEHTLKAMVLRKHLLPVFGGKRLDEIGALDVDGYKAMKLAAGYKAATINNHIALLNRIQTIAVEWGIVPAALKFKKLPEMAPEFDFLTFEEADRLVAAARPQWRSMLLIALNTGLRQGEILALRWQDVDLTGRRLMVRRSAVNGYINMPKSGRPREVPLNEIAVSAFKAQRAWSGLPDALVFPGPKGRLLKANDAWHPLMSTCRRAGLREVGWHVMRHSFASHLVIHGASLKVVQELLGHASMEMTLRYAHLSPEAKTDAVALLQRQPGGNSSASGRSS